MLSRIESLRSAALTGSVSGEHLRKRDELVVEIQRQLDLIAGSIEGVGRVTTNDPSRNLQGDASIVAFPPGAKAGTWLVRLHFDLQAGTLSGWVPSEQNHQVTVSFLDKPAATAVGEALNGLAEPMARVLIGLDVAANSRGEAER